MLESLEVYGGNASGSLSYYLPTQFADIDICNTSGKIPISR